MEYDEWKADLKVVKKDLKSAWIKRTLRDKKNLHIFGRYFFPHIIKGTDDVPECHMDLLEAINSPDDGAIIFPRGFAKSTWIRLDIIHDIVYGLEPVILYISNTLTDAGFHFESIKTELENNDLLRWVYGDMVPPETKKDRKWTNKHFETINGINVVARGSGKGRGVNIKNQRPTKIVGDDIEDDEHIRSADQRAKLHHWLYHVVFPSKDAKRGKIKLVGTVLHTEAEILNFYNKHGGIFRKAIEDGKSIWPGYYSLDDLEDIREKIGTRAFTQEYMNNPTSDEMANFKPIWIDDNYFTTLPKMGRPRMVIACDPQAGETTDADEFAITALAWDETDSHRYVIEQKAGRASQGDQAKFAIQMWWKYRKDFVIKVVGIEKVLAQTAVYQNAIDWKNGKIELKGLEKVENKNIPIKGTDPGGKDKVARLQMQEAKFERGEVHLRPEMKTLRDQILFLGKGVLEHDDRCDSLVMALELSYTRLGSEKKDDKLKEKQETVAGNLMKQKF